MIYIHWPALEWTAVMAFLPPMADQMRACACVFVVALMQPDRDEWRWIAQFQQQHGIQKESGGSSLHRKPKERRDGEQAGKEGKRSRGGGRSKRVEGGRDNVREEPEGGGMDAGVENGREEGSIHPNFIANVSVLEVKMGAITKTRRLYLLSVLSARYIDVSNCYFNLFEIR